MTPADKPKPIKLYQAQPINNRMLYALAPVAISAVYFFGWRAVAVLAVVFAAGLIAEWVMERQRGKPVATAGLVTCVLYGLSLPPTVPYWIAGVGAVVAILFGKEVFGGFGRNPFNPAIVGRTFVYICFPVDLTGRFVPAFEGFPGGFAQWSFESLKQLPERMAVAGKGVVDAVSQASPMWANREVGHETPWQRLAMGNISGLFETDGGQRILSAGSMGEGCAVIIVLAAVYLLLTKTAKWQLMIPGLLGVVVANVVFRDVLGFGSSFDGETFVYGIPPLHLTLLSGTTLFAVVFMVTEPVSAPKKPRAQMAYAFIIGCLIVLLRWRGVFVAAASFSILMGNLIGPLLDLAANRLAARKKARAAAGGPA